MKPDKVTGWPAPDLMQDDCRSLFRWFASKPEAKLLVRQRCEEIRRSKEMAIDRELLELAAKAAGYEKDWQYQVYWLDSAGGCVKLNNAWHKWNPLTNHGDALCLAIKLGMKVEIDWVKFRVSVWNGSNLWVCETLSTNGIDCDVDPYAATCRAIVRAAASTTNES